MRIYGALVTIGYFIMTQTRLSINISPGDLSVALHMLDVAEPVEVLTSEILECLAINHKRRTLKAFEPFLGSPDWDFDPVYVWLKESAWISDRGKEFIRELRTKYPKAASDADRSDSEEEWIVEQEVTVEHSEIEGDHLVPPKAKRAKLSDESVGDDLVAKGAHPLPTVQPSSSHLHNGDDDDDEGLCMICLDKIADTIVHPCLHCVVCSACSIKLRDSADSRKCVRCRCDIEFIDE